LGRGREVGVGLPPDSADDTNTVANILTPNKSGGRSRSCCVDLKIIRWNRSREFTTASHRHLTRRS